MEMLCKKETPIEGFRLCGGDQGSAFGNRKLLKKFDQNFRQHYKNRQRVGSWGPMRDGSRSHCSETKENDVQ